MQTLSSASRTCMAEASAVECTATVRMPISWQARWMRSAISPRLAIRTLPNIMACSPCGRAPAASRAARLPYRTRAAFRAPCSFDDHQRLAIFHGRAGLDQDAGHGAGARRLDLVEGLHRLDQQQGLALGDLGAEGDEGRLARLRRQIGDADH